MNPEQLRDASLLDLFALEADAQADVLNAGLLALERDPTAAVQLEACMRTFAQGPRASSGSTVACALRM
jgi:two-component system sensor histidine kinase and response regulator WspE